MCDEEAQDCAGLRCSTQSEKGREVEKGLGRTRLFAGVTVTQVSGRTDAMDDETVNNTVGAAVGAAISELQLTSPVRLSLRRERAKSECDGDTAAGGRGGGGIGGV